MNGSQLSTRILFNFQHTPTSDQLEFIERFSVFIIQKKNRTLFLLKGYAGTGKTSLVSALVKVLPEIKMNSVLLAPTGRAAKVLASYSEKRAQTIHQKIYFARTSKEGNIILKLQKNMQKNTLFIVDEASMIPDNSKSSGSLFGGHALLDDLIDYVFSGENCKLLFIGDQAQLPPVGLDLSPALDTDYLKTTYDLTISNFQLTEVIRQEQDSGILMNATTIRNQIGNQIAANPMMDLNNYRDIQRINNLDLSEALFEAFPGNNLDNSVVITRSNKRANLYNQEIRKRILFREYEIETGDYLMVVKNNYFWLPTSSKAGFIANGDVLEMLRLRRIEEMYGFRFADVTVRLADYPDEEEFDVKIILDTLMSESPALSQADNNRLYNEVLQDYMGIKSRKERAEKIRINPYFNALQIKFAYALTCHKTQGGQWKTVFIDQGWLPDNYLNIEYLRWIYTAVTRASEKLYLVGFKDEFFKE